MTPSTRCRVANHAPIQYERDYVLYWMVAARRPHSNFALDHAIEEARALNRPLLVVEALNLEHPHASPRLHAFVLDGMRDNQRAFADSPVRYLAYVESHPGEGKGLLEALASRACLLISDDWPSYFIGRIQRALAERIDLRFELVDGNGITPLAASPRAFETALSFRRWFQARAAADLRATPVAQPLRACSLPDAARLDLEFLAAWKFGIPEDRDRYLATLPPQVGVLPGTTGGWSSARQILEQFVEHTLPNYGVREADALAPNTSGLSPYLHFGHISAHEIVAAILDGVEDPLPRIEHMPRRGARSGWWGLDPAREAFLDQLIVWRELLHHFAWRHSDIGLQSLPAWARETLDIHWNDPRPFVYELGEFEAARTHDPIWNAAQRQLVETGSMHGYLRMLWGKKILHWSKNPLTAWEIMVTLNDRWALDGRDPNSYGSMLWILGGFDRPWGPERPIFGKVRYMSSDNTRRKLRLQAYLDRFGDERPLFTEGQTT